VYTEIQTSIYSYSRMFRQGKFHSQNSMACPFALSFCYQKWMRFIEQRTIFTDVNSEHSVSNTDVRIMTATKRLEAEQACLNFNVKHSLNPTHTCWRIHISDYEKIFGETFFQVVVYISWKNILCVSFLSLSTIY
jgi:hypothetical protein